MGRVRYPRKFAGLPEARQTHPVGVRTTQLSPSSPFVNRVSAFGDLRYRQIYDAGRGLVQSILPNIADDSGDLANGIFESGPVNLPMRMYWPIGFSL